MCPVLRESRSVPGLPGVRVPLPVLGGWTEAGVVGGTVATTTGQAHGTPGCPRHLHRCQTRDWTQLDVFDVLGQTGERGQLLPWHGMQSGGWWHGQREASV